MDDAPLRDQLRASEERNAALQGELQSLRASLAHVFEGFATFRRDHEALIEATRLLSEERDALRRRVTELEAANRRLVDMLWGRRSERRSDAPDQGRLNFGAEADEPPSAAEQQIIEAQAAADEAADRELLRQLEARRKARREKRSRSEELPPHLERRERVLDLPEEQKAGLKCIGVKVVERLRFEKPHLYVEVIKRPQYVAAGRPAAGVRSVPPPLAIVEGCKYDFSVVAAVLAMKFAFHLPTYRQQDWFAQCGWSPSRSTTNDLVGYGVAAIGPLYRQMWQLLVAQPILLGDDTSLEVLLRGSLSAEEQATLAKRKRAGGATETGPPSTKPPGSAASYAWLYTGLDELAPYNVFHWSLTHQQAVIDGHLAGFRGVFVGDAAGANARLAQRSGGRIVHASCNAHARREFVNAESNDPVLASRAISFYRQLYDVEERGKTLDAEARLELRAREAAPIWNRMRRWLDSAPARRALPRSAIGAALGYLRNQWAALRVYLSDGHIPIDNNQSERAIRPLTVGRSNWLFLGHPRAAAGRLQMYSIVSSAHRHHLVIGEYLEDVLCKLCDAQQNRPADLEPGSPYLRELLPDHWALAHPDSVCRDRIAEREMVSDVKRLRRVKTRIENRAAAVADGR